MVDLIGTVQWPCAVPQGALAQHCAVRKLYLGDLERETENSARLLAVDCVHAIVEHGELNTVY